MSTINLLHFNNYLNRIVKRFETIAEYLDYVVTDGVYTNMNFNPADGVSTTITIGRGEFIDIPDYAVITNENNEIMSRWYVLHADRTRGGQYLLSLYRDTVADFWGVIADADSFIEKAQLYGDDPFLFNAENMTFNQILTSQHLLQDETKTAWAVGYIPRDSFTEAKTITTVAEYDETLDIVDTVNSLEDWEYYQYVDTPGHEATRIKGEYEKGVFQIQYSAKLRKTLEKDCLIDAYYDYNTGTYINQYVFYEGLVVHSYLRVLRTRPSGITSFIDFNPVSASIFFPSTEDLERIKTLTNNFGGNNTPLFKEIKQLNNKIISIANELYQIELYNTGFTAQSLYPTPGTELHELYKNIVLSSIENAGYYYNTDEFEPPQDAFSMGLEYGNYVIRLKPYQTQRVTTELDSARYNVINQPYDIFCIPVNSTTFYYNELVDGALERKEISTLSNVAIPIAQEIGRQTGSANVYDVQLLPYCPARYIIKEDGLDLTNIQYDIVYKTEDETKTPISVILWATSESFNFEIPFNVDLENNNIEKKVKALTDLHRICSPNYAGIFEFNAQKNNGVTAIQVDCTYKPFNPFIHLRPNFGGLYGINPDKDSRGLVCGGDFSLAQSTNAWANYELNNKNYQAIFDRQIQNMEINNSVARTKEIFGAITGTVQGSVSGAMAGSTAGPYGAIAGAVVGGVSSMAGGIADVTLNDQLRREGIDYTRDLFGYQLGNIRALPSALSKTSALVYSNKIFPFVEYYTATEKEKEALRNKIKFNGMTVMRIGKITDYVSYPSNGADPQYIKAQIIRLNGLNDDYHLANTIASELNKGVFL